MSLLRRDRNGIAAVEFALLAPILIVLYFGITEIGDAVVVYTKVTHTASAVNDLVSQAKIISNNDMQNIFNYAAFNNPSTDPTNTNFGKVTTAVASAGAMRFVNFVVKFSF